MSSHEMKDITQEAAVIVEVTSDAKDTITDRDNAILARLGKKSVLKVSFCFIPSYRQKLWFIKF